ncbi:hypothetical protein SUGI_0322690 [Cryptomeria japonica]|nr:hypothetical protein SUGI_0322690 [Cryptomeria japonica]
MKIVCGLLKYVNDFARKKDGTFNRGLMNFVEYKVAANPEPNRGVYTKDVVIDLHTGVWVRIFVPEEIAGSNHQEEDELLPIVFYFHGGGFASLTPDFLLYDVFCRRMARRRRVIVVSVGYRRAPENKYPVAYEDSFAVVKWAGSADGRNNLPAKADFSKCFLMGDSAGANIVHHLACRIAASGEEISPMKVVGNVLIQPFFGGEERTPSELRLVGAPIVSIENSDWHWKAFLPEGANRDHPAANVFGPNAPDISNLTLPPFLVVVGGHDPLQDWQLRYVDNLTKIKKEVELLFYGEAVHTFHLFFQIPGSSKFISDLNAFFRKCGK